MGSPFFVHDITVPGVWSLADHSSSAVIPAWSHYAGLHYIADPVRLEASLISDPECNDQMSHKFVFLDSSVPSDRSITFDFQ
jgi:hypothetical protein